MRFIHKIKNSIQKRFVKGIFKNFFINNFSRLFYYHAGEISWMGVKALKNHTDLWIYQEMMYENKPDFIIETGTKYGGSAYYLAHICDILNHGSIITIDNDNTLQRPTHPRITYVNNSSTHPEVIEILKNKLSQSTKKMFILDSDHSKKHVLEELNLYKQFIEVGEYIVVEDTNINGHPVLPHFGPGPMEAVTEFLKMNSNFISDRSKERLFHTHNPKGFLKRIR